MEIPGGGGRDYRAYYASSSSPSSSSSSSAQSSTEGRPLPSGISLHVHLTDPLNTSEIYWGGLTPGVRNGINMGGQPDSQYIYVLDGSSRETNNLIAGYIVGGAAPVGVISTGNHYADENFPEGGSALYAGGAPPVKDFSGGPGPFSFTIPITEDSARGITDFVNHHRPQGQRELSERDALARVRGHLYRNFDVTESGSFRVPQALAPEATSYLSQNSWSEVSSGRSSGSRHNANSGSSSNRLRAHRR